MKICHITHGRVNPDGENGITRTVYNLNKYLNLSGIHSEIFSFNDKQNEVEDYYRDEFTSVKLFPRYNPIKQNKFKNYILSDQFDFDIVHFHLMWMIDKNSIIAALSKRGIPYLITTHAAYTPDRIDSIKKKLAMRTLEKKYLFDAKSIHALCNEEKKFLRELGLKNSIYVIPNGISDVEIKKINESKKLINPYENNFINLVWVGRLRNDKNILGIVESLNYIDDKIKKTIKIHLVGNGIKSYEIKVKNLIRKYKLNDHVILHGPKYKEEKYQYILNADIYIQPSYSEGISFSILDAMACSKAMVLSRQTNMTYYYYKNFYLMCEPDAEDIANKISKLVVDSTLRKQLALNAKNLVDTTLNWNYLIEKYIAMYQKLKN